MLLILKSILENGKDSRYVLSHTVFRRRLSHKEDVRHENQLRKKEELRQEII